MIRTREQKGITLVALIITIIVLLILAVVAIRAVQDGGIIQHAQNARNEYIIGEAKEKEALRDYLTKLEEEVSEIPYIVHNDTIPVGGTYKVAGTETELKSEEGKYVKFPETVKDGDIYIYGDYEYRYNMCYDETNGWTYNITQEGWGVRVKADNTSKLIYGNILTTINGKNITNMQYCFSNCKSLTTTPAIPNSVTNMYATFYKCTSLTQTKKIPNTVINMRSAFSGCKALVTAPEIPNSVKNMFRTFYNCTSLKNIPKISNNVENLEGAFEFCTVLEKAPEIPNSVTNLFATFYGCRNLKGKVIINAQSSKLTRYDKCFYDTTKAITLEGSNNNNAVLDLLKNTANNGNITVPAVNS